MLNKLIKFGKNIDCKLEHHLLVPSQFIETAENYHKVKEWLCLNCSATWIDYEAQALKHDVHKVDHFKYVGGSK